MKVGAEVSKRFVTNVLGSLAGFLGTLVFTRLLGFDGIGTFAIFVSIQMIAANLSSFGLYTVLTKRVSEGDDQAAYFTTGALVLLGGVAAITVLLVPLRGFVDGVVGLDVALIVPLGVLTWGLFRLSTAYLEGQQRVALAGAIENGRHAIIVPIQAAFVLNDFGVIGLVYGVVAGQFVTFLIAYFGYARVVPNLPSRALLGDFLDYSKYAYVQNVSSQLFKHADYIIIGQFAGQGPTGVYKNVFALTEAAMLFSSALSQVTFPQFSALSEVGDDAEINRLFAALFTYAGLFAIPLVGGGAVIGNDVLLTLYGENPGTTTIPIVGVVGLANVLVPVLAVANLLNGYRNGLEKYFLGTGNPRVYAASGLLLILVYAVTAVPLTMAYDAWGVASATVLAFGSSVAAMLYYLEQPVPLSSLGDVGKEVVAMVAMTAVVYVLVDALGAAHGALRLGFVLAVGGGTYFAILLALSERVRVDVFAVSRDLIDEVR
ncbi:oligosaccharide flippase family protein [Halorubellus sp. JP-L1]|uniref:oligosaccharide flippase family protein n=1 Tax=Halorubellus sp. JP-L1 TaxID=2715753 RepID=UPI00140816D6|nr:oligosaccharide flippase family protein [Halorubellus sp. JP-L1]NHN41086.1 oligosaccharide flippase family protein [Halorubellus sp. JP-L1]